MCRERRTAPSLSPTTTPLVVRASGRQLRRRHHHPSLALHALQHRWLRLRGCGVHAATPHHLPQGGGANFPNRTLTHRMSEIGGIIGVQHATHRQLLLLRHEERGNPVEIDLRITAATLAHDGKANQRKDDDDHLQGNEQTPICTSSSHHVDTLGILLDVVGLFPSRGTALRLRFLRPHAIPTQLPFPVSLRRDAILLLQRLYL